MDVDSFPDISIGHEVDIQRSNGRIHSALVSGVNMGARSVTVEWFEGGETKGKEVRNLPEISWNIPDLSSC